MKVAYGFLFLLMSVSCFAQFRIYDFDGLNIGDKMPNVRLTNIVNFPTNEVQFSQFKDKLVILDFWSKDCSSCIAAFPKMQQLQEKFGNKIQILLVCRDSERDVDNLLKVNRNVKNTSLPILKHDTVLHRLFPHSTVPYHVWIDGKGIVKVLANSQATTEGNIRKLLSGDSLDLPVSKPEVNDLSLLDKSFLEQICSREVQKNQLQSYSLFMKKSKLTSQNIGGAGTNVSNVSIINIFRNIYWQYGSEWEYRNPVMVEVTKKENLAKYYPPANEDDLYKWEEENMYCYEVKLPSYINFKSMPPKQWYAKVKEIMIQDCERFLNVKTFIQERAVPCLILSSLHADAAKNIQTKGGETAYSKIGKKYIYTNVSNSSIGDPFRNIAKVNSPDEMPFLNEVAINGNIDFEIEDADTLEDYNTQLSKYGLKLKIEVRKIKCLIIRENNS